MFFLFQTNLSLLYIYLYYFSSFLSFSLSGFESMRVILDCLFVSVNNIEEGGSSGGFCDLVNVKQHFYYYG
jgi:hypothetical protein